MKDENGNNVYIDYSNYIAEKVDKNVSYTEYVAERVSYSYENEKLLVEFAKKYLNISESEIHEKDIVTMKLRDKNIDLLLD